jgi:DNA polymerase-1
MTPRPTTIDVETHPIEGRPNYPPMPVGVAIKPWGEPARYYGFGHETGEQNATVAEAMAAVRAAYECSEGVLFHNAKFDLEVIEAWFNIPPPPIERVHDSMLLLFLDDPNQREIGLKPAAARLLKWAPEERDAVADWLIQNQPVPNIRVSRGAKGNNPPGAYIAWAPIDVVGPYAIGDVDRTAALFEHLWDKVMAERILDGEPLDGMRAAYDLERQLILVLLDMEQRGIDVDIARLMVDTRDYETTRRDLEAWIREQLGVSDTVLLSGAQLVDALASAGMVDPAQLGVTPTGKAKSDQDSINAAVTNKQVAAALVYLSQLRTCLNTFMKPWMETALKKESRGRIYTTWHQTRGAGGGARTGRLSSSPNFQNIPKEFSPIFRDEANPGLPEEPIRLPALPMCRRYLMARPGEVFAGRDFSGQELRILAHFENADMAAAYQMDPKLDLHAMAATMMTKVAGKEVTRNVAKTLGFAVLYGAGPGRVAKQINCSFADADTFVKAYYRTFPGVDLLRDDLTYRVRTNAPIRTVGGRYYGVEKLEGRDLTYKMINTIVQGSAADQTKAAMVRFHRLAGPGKLVLTVHDELIISTTPARLEADMELLRQAMDEPILAVPVLSEGKVGKVWAEMEKAA